MKTAKAFTANAAPFAVLGGLAAAAAGFSLYPNYSPAQKWIITILILLGLGMFVFGAGLLSSARFAGWVHRRAARLKSLTRLTAAQFIYLALAVLAGWTASLAGGRHPNQAVAPWLSLGAWGMALVLGVLATWDSTEAFPRVSKKSLLTVGLLLAAALVLRAVALEKAPPLLNGDEASAGLSAAQFISGVSNHVFGVGWFSFPAMYFAVQSLSIRLFGQTVFALRFTSALAGSLTVAAVYLVGKRLFSERAGVLAALFLLGSHFHNHFSRIGLNNIWDGLWYLLTLGFLVDGWRHQRRSSFIIAGLSFGLAQYFYASSRFLLGLVPVWLLMAALFNRKKWRGNRMNILCMLLAFVLVVFPAAWFYAQKGNLVHLAAPFNRVDVLGDWLHTEMELVGKPGWQIVAGMIYTSARTLVSIPSQVWYPAHTPILRPLAAVLFLAGLLWMLFYLRKPFTWMLYLWIAAFIVVGGLSVPASSAQRYIALIPACALVIGFGLDETIRQIDKVWQDKEKWLYGGALALCVLMGVSDMLFYFNKYTPATRLGGENTLVAQRLAEYLHDKGKVQVAFWGADRMGYTSINTTAYLAPQARGLDFQYPWGNPENPPLAEGPVVFVFLPGEEQNLPLVQSDYPGGEMIVAYDFDEGPLYWLYAAP